MDDVSGAVDTGMALGMLAFLAVFGLAIWLFYGFCIGKILEKAGKPMWTGFVPIYNMLLLIEIVGRPSWWIIGCLVPYVNIIFLVLLYIDLAKSFGKDTGYGILLILFSFIMLPMMAFSDDVRYVGPAAKQST